MGPKVPYCNIFRLGSPRTSGYKRWEQIRKGPRSRLDGHGIESVGGIHPLHRTFEKFAKEADLEEGRYLIVPCDDDRMHVAVEADLVRSAVEIREVPA